MKTNIQIDDKLIEALSSKITSQEDLAELSRQLLKQTVERALNAELDNHLGYIKHSIDGNNTGNSRNGCTAKTIKGDFGEVVISNPRDRNSSFEPELIGKNQTSFGEFDKKILALYAKGMTTRDISSAMHEMYGADVSHTVISKVTDAILYEVRTWQSRPLDSIYPIVYLDCIVVKVHQDKRVINKSVYLALAINTSGHKELLGMWIAENEGSKFWLSILTELQTRGVKDIFIACVDGLKGFSEAINTVYPKSKVQLCVVHLMRNSLKYVSHKEMKEVANDLKSIYRAISLPDDEQALDKFSSKWDNKYPAVSKIWYNNWENIITIFDYPDEIRKIIFTTNAIESLNSVIRKSIRNRKIFPNDDSVFKVLYLDIDRASKKWSMPLRDWKSTMNRFAIEFQERFPE
jgi:putative transposase